MLVNSGVCSPISRPGASPLRAPPYVDPSPSPSPSPQASIRAPTPALPSPPPPGSAALETSPTAASVAAPDEVKTPVSAVAAPMAPSLPALPFLSHLGSDKGAAIVHAPPPTPASGLGQPAMSPTLATSALPTPAASPSPSPRATPAPESLGTILLIALSATSKKLRCSSVAKPSHFYRLSGAWRRRPSAVSAVRSRLIICKRISHLRARPKKNPRRTRP